ncbi:MAG: hypothetical protein Q9169_007373 [Polycauliona sp. 2 TL-2023]
MDHGSFSTDGPPETEEVPYALPELNLTSVELNLDAFNSRPSIDVSAVPDLFMTDPDLDFDFLIPNHGVDSYIPESDTSSVEYEDSIAESCEDGSARTPPASLPPESHMPRPDLEAQSNLFTPQAPKQVVTWNGPEDPTNPHNWPKSKRWISMLLVSSSTFISPMASTMVAPALEDIADEFDIKSDVEEFLVMSIFLLAYAVGPFLWGPLSEVYGRVKVLQAANLFFLLFNTVCGFAKTKEQMMAFRFLSGIGGSAPQAVLAFLFLNETFAPVLLARKAAALREQTGNHQLRTKWQGPDHSMKKLLMKSLVRPFIMLATQPALQAMALFRAYQYGLMYLALATFPMVFEGAYDQGVGRASLNYLSLGIGFVVGLQISGPLQDKIYTYCKRHQIDPSAPVFARQTWRVPHGQTHLSTTGDTKALMFKIPRKPIPPRRTGTAKSLTQDPTRALPEYRLPLTLPFALLIPIGLFIYGWSAQHKRHWIFPNIGACIFAMGLIICFNCAQAYVVDTYTTYAASATGAAAFSLVLSSKIFHSLATKFLQQHLILRKKYSSLTFCKSDEDEDEDEDESDLEPNDTNDLLLFFGAIIENPSITCYPTTLRYDGNQPDDRQEIYDEELSRRMVDSCDFIPLLNKEQATADLCQPDSTGATVNLLMTMLPNLKHLKTKNLQYHNGDRKQRKEFRNLMWIIAEAIRNPESPAYGKALTRLESFSLTHTAESYADDLEEFASFAMMPSMRILSGTGIAGDGFEWPPESVVRQSNVTEIEFTDSAVNASAFDNILSRIAALRRFTYNHAGAYVGRPNNHLGVVVGYAAYSPWGYVKALRKHAASSLRTMSIDSHNDDSLIEVGLRYVGSLKMFSALETIRLEDVAFQRDYGTMSEDSQGIEPSYHYRDDKDEYYAEMMEASEGEESTNDLREPEDTYRNMERLVDILPASVKSFTLIITPPESPDMRELFEGTPEEKAGQLPNLEEIILEGMEVPLEDDLKVKLEEAGLQLKFVERAPMTSSNTRELFDGMPEEKLEKLPSLEEVMFEDTEAPLEHDLRAKLEEAGLRLKFARQHKESASGADAYSST